MSNQASEPGERPVNPRLSRTVESPSMTQTRVPTPGFVVGLCSDTWWARRASRLRRPEFIRQHMASVLIVVRPPRMLTAKIWVLAHTPAQRKVFPPLYHSTFRRKRSFGLVQLNSTVFAWCRVHAVAVRP